MTYFISDLAWRTDRNHPDVFLWLLPFFCILFSLCWLLQPVEYAFRAIASAAKRAKKSRPKAAR